MPRGIHTALGRGEQQLLKNPADMPTAAICTCRLRLPERGNGPSSFNSTVGKRRMGLGGGKSGNVTLADAREKAVEARRQLAQGIDPIEARKGVLASARVAGVKFGKFADEYVKSHQSEWSNTKHAAQWNMTMGDAYCSFIRNKSIAAIQTEDILAVWSRSGRKFQKRPAEYA